MVELVQEAALKVGGLAFLIALGGMDTVGREDELVHREEQNDAQDDEENGVVLHLGQQGQSHPATLCGWHAAGKRNNPRVDEVKPLTPPDVHHWEAAQGWTGLRNAKEAFAELEKIQPDFQAHPFVRSAWLDAWILGGEWDKARGMARKLVEEFPDEPGFWLHLAYATRRAESGGMELALDVLNGVMSQFPQEWMIPYNMACYLCQLERLDEAKPKLSVALVIGGSAIRTSALADEDLKPLWPWVKKRR